MQTAAIYILLADLITAIQLRLCYNMWLCMATKEYSKKNDLYTMKTVTVKLACPLAYPSELAICIWGRSYIYAALFEIKLNLKFYS